LKPSLARAKETQHGQSSIHPQGWVPIETEYVAEEHQ